MSISTRFIGKSAADYFTFISALRTNFGHLVHTTPDGSWFDSPWNRLSHQGIENQRSVMLIFDHAAITAYSRGAVGASSIPPNILLAVSQQGQRDYRSRIRGEWVD